jgi:hypothetical protein
MKNTQRLFILVLILATVSSQTATGRSLPSFYTATIKPTFTAPTGADTTSTFTHTIAKSGIFLSNEDIFKAVGNYDFIQH